MKRYRLTVRMHDGEIGCLLEYTMNDIAKKLADYEDAEEQGLLKMLPCPIGTMVHEPYKFCDDGAWEIDHHYLKLEDLDKIGKTVFVDENDAKAYIAEQEAKSALAEKGGA